MSYISKLKGLQRRALLSLVVVAMLMALLPTVAFAGSPRNNRPHGPSPEQSHQRDSNNNWNNNNGNSGGSWDRGGGNHNNSCAATYRVRRGDTLSAISRQFRVPVHAIAQANGIRNPNRIYAGQRLCIPR
jgi:cell envelope opacity-associated protein A